MPVVCRAHERARARLRHGVPESKTAAIAVNPAAATQNRRAATQNPHTLAQAKLKLSALLKYAA
jgi:hypothetical protein